MQVKPKKFEFIESGHLTSEVLIEDTQNNLQCQRKFKTEILNCGNWQKRLTPHLSNYIDNFPDNITEDKIEKKTNLLTDIVTTATEYFGLTQASKKIRKEWWSKDVK